MKLRFHILFVFVLTSWFLFGTTQAEAQVCDSLVETYYADLSSDSDSTWYSPWIKRVGHCCDASGPSECVHFVVTLSDDAQGIIFDVYDGAVPNGSLYYQVECGPQTECGVQICLYGPGPHNITFCKPGANENIYSIQSVPRPNAGADEYLRDGCSGVIQAQGYDTTTIQWNSVYPGAVGTYNDYMDCSICSIVNVTGKPGFPPYVDFEVCGIPSGGCIDDVVCDTARVYFDPSLFAQIMPEMPTICYGSNATTITGNGIGGTPPYSYQWSTGETAQSIDAMVGFYYLTVSDATNCPPNYDTVEVTEFFDNIQAIAGPDMTVCTSSFPVELNGNVVEASGGVWINGTGTFAPSPDSLITTYMPSDQEVQAGFFTLGLVTTGNGSCPADTDWIDITILNFNASIQLSYSDVNCFGYNDGTANVNITNGNPPFNVTWSTSPIQTGNTAINLAPGNYSVIVQDILGCDTTLLFPIVQPTPLNSVGTFSNINCYGNSNGSIIVIPSGGTPGYSYNWSNGSSAQNLQNLPPGNYSVTITDLNNCPSLYSATITQPAQLTCSLSSSDVVCNGNGDGAITSTIAGGVTPYSMMWTNGETVNNISGLVPGSYTLTILDGNSCFVTQTATIQEPSLLVGAVTPNTLPCNGLSTGEITSTVSGGITPYTFLWSSGQTVQDISGLTAGDYVLTVTDSNACVIELMASVIEPDTILVTDVISNLICAGGEDGSIDITITGGTIPYSIIWSNGQTVEDISSLIAGNYSVTVNDQNNCQVIYNYIVTEPSDLIVNYTINDISCNGLQDGSIDLTIEGGLPPFVFNWSDGSTNENLTSADTGYYSVTITSSSGCKILDSLYLVEPEILTLSISETNIVCNGYANGTISSAVTGGITPYSYQWTGGETTSAISNLIEGNYSLTMSDANGCTLTESVFIDEAPPLIVTSSSTGVSCYGNPDGNIYIDVVGGMAPYTFQWSNGRTTEDNVGSYAGTYTVTVTDFYGCKVTETNSIAQPASLNASVVITDALCFGDSNGSFDVSVTGGTPPYDYIWTNGATTQDISGLPAGYYSLSITTFDGCEVLDSLPIKQPGLLVPVLINTNVLCFGGSDGIINLTVEGGTSPFTFLWSDNSTDEDLSGVAIGTYSVTVTDANGCISDASTYMNEPIPLSLTFSSNDVSCFGLSNGDIEVFPSGGVPYSIGQPYHFLWNIDSTTQAITDLIAGFYTVTVSDSNACEIIETIEITQPLHLDIVADTNDITCFGYGDGSINLSVSGDLPPYQFLWSNGATDQNNSSLDTGYYSVTVISTAGCDIADSLLISEPDSLSLEINSQLASCFGFNDGVLNVVPAGGISPYSYSWSQGGTDQSILDSAGTYTVTVSDFNSCTNQITSIIAEPTQLELESFIINPLCNNDQNGIIDQVVSGGTLPYSFSWSTADGSGLIPGLIDQFMLTGGSYNASITDANGCLLTQTYTLVNPDLISLSATISDVSCFGSYDGSIILDVTGGNPGYQFYWQSNDGSGIVLLAQNQPHLTTGTYTITVFDVNQCSATASYFVNQPFPLQISGSAITNVSCFNGVDGAIDITASGGTTPYNYFWTTANGTGLVQGQEDQSGLTAGLYKLSITDSEGCMVPANYSVTQPAQLNVGAVLTNVSCNGFSDGRIDLTISGGTPAYTFNWETSGGIGLQQGQEDQTAITDGMYSVTVTDSHGCSKTRIFFVQEPPVLSIDDTVFDATCFGYANGNIDITITGGSFPYYYNWSDGRTSQDLTNIGVGAYSVSVTDFHSCTLQSSYVVQSPDSIEFSFQIKDATCYSFSNGNILTSVSGGTLPYSFGWSNNEQTSDIYNLTTGYYFVAVTDSNYCFNYDSVFISEPDSLLAVYIMDSVTCFGFANGGIEAYPSGGTSPYHYEWSTGDSVYQVSGLSGGSYPVTITDSLGCVIDSSVFVFEPDTLLAVDSIRNASCFEFSDGEVYLNITGGLEPYSFEWSTGGTDSYITQLTAETYSVTVSDSNFCAITHSSEITEPLVLTDFLSSDSCLCYQSTDGVAYSIISGGTLPYYFQWEGGSSSSAATNLPSGYVSLTVTDSHGCVLIDSIFIEQPDSISVAFSSTAAWCHGYSDGALLSTVSGATPGYEYNWSNGGSDNLITNVPAGQYFLTVTDANACTGVYSGIVGEPDAIIINISKADVLCYGGNSGSAYATAWGGTGGFDYQWGASSGNQTGQSAQMLSMGYAYLTVTDDHSCTATSSILIQQPPKLESSITGENVSCFGYEDGNSRVFINGGVLPYSYIWSNSESTMTNVNLDEGIYSVVVTDANGCVITDTIEIIQPDLLVASISPPDTICVGNSSTISIYTTGGNGGNQYEWNFPELTGSEEIVSPDTITYYSVQVTDELGCTSSTVSVKIYVRNLSKEAIDAISLGDICLGETTGVYGVHLDQLGSYSYEWSNGLGNSLETISVSPEHSITYYLSVTDLICNNLFVDSIFVDVYEPPVFGLLNMEFVGCEPLTVTFLDTAMNYAHFTFQWKFGDGDSSYAYAPVHTYKEDGIYEVYVSATSVANCESAADTICRVTVLPNEPPKIIPNPPIVDVQHPDILFSTVRNDYVSYLWYFGDGDSSIFNQPIHEYGDTGSYIVTLFTLNEYYCENSATVPVLVKPMYLLDIPNAFSPDPSGPSGGVFNMNDPNNDIFFPIIRNPQYIKNYVFKIFSRWGELIFVSTEMNVGWDGYYRDELCKQDVYIYKIEFDVVTGEHIVTRGDVTLLR